MQDMDDDEDDNREDAGEDEGEDDGEDDLAESELESLMPQQRQPIVIDISVLYFSYLEEYQTQ